MYKDKDINTENQIYRLQQAKNTNNKITSVFLALLLSIIGTVDLYIIKDGTKYILRHTNPFDGNHINYDFIADYQAIKVDEFISDGSFKDIVKHIKNSDIDEKKAYALYYALLENQYLTKEEKEKLKGFIQYFIDNKYLDYEHVYQKLSSFSINPDNVNLFGNENVIGGTYYPTNNSITFTSLEGRSFALSHEISHAEDNSITLPYSDFAWYIEDLTALLDYEYNDKSQPSYKEEITFCRILCELVGSDVLFETRAKGNFDILVNAFVNKEIEKQEVIRLFDLFNKYSFEKKSENPSFNELRIEILKSLQRIYLNINKDKNYASPVFYNYLLNIAQGTDEFISPKYYFNSLKKDKVPITKGVNMDENTYELVESIYEYYDDYIQQTNEFSRSPANTTQQRHLPKTEKIYMTKESLNEKITGMIDHLSENQKSK